MRSVSSAHSIEGFRSLIENSFYVHDAHLLSDRGVGSDFELTTTNAGLLPVTRYSGGIDVGVRRLWKHIRTRPSELYLIWFPLAGSVAITQDKALDSLAEVGEFLITCADRPFYARSLQDENGRCSHLSIVAPSHVMRSLLPSVDKICGHAFQTGGASAIALDIFNGLISGSNDIGVEAAARLGQAGLEAITESVRHQVTGELIEVDTKKIHLHRVLRFIDQNLPLQGLTAERVAGACKISRRYLHYLMRAHNTTFGEYLWEIRLKQAREWLLDPEFSHFNIVDIAYMCGFRSASHFSNSYHARFGQPPRDARSLETVHQLEES